MLATAAPYLVQLLLQPLSYRLVDSRGRRCLLLAFLPLTALASALLALSQWLLLFRGLEGGRWLSLGAIALFFASNGTGVQPIVYTLKGEIFPLPVRTSSTALTTVVSWLSSFVASFAFLSLRATPTGAVRMLAHSLHSLRS